MDPISTGQTTTVPVSNVPISDGPGSATVIPFPRRDAALSRSASRPASSSVPGPMPEARERLARALDGLNAMLAEQRAAMAAWRASLAELRACAAGLGTSLERYQTNLASVGEGVSSLRARAKVLQTWAETNEAQRNEAQGTS